MDCGPPGSSVRAFSHAGILEWVAISSSRGSSHPRDQTHVFCISRWILYCWAIREIPVGLFLLTYFFLLVMSHILLLLFMPGKLMGSQGVRHDLATKQQVFIELSRWLRVKNLPASARDMGSIPGTGRSHMLQNKKAQSTQLLGLCSKAQELQLLSSLATITETRVA